MADGMLTFVRAFAIFLSKEDEFRCFTVSSSSLAAFGVSKRPERSFAALVMDAAGPRPIIIFPVKSEHERRIYEDSLFCARRRLLINTEEEEEKEKEA
jgi:hypothetical protein